MTTTPEVAERLVLDTSALMAVLLDEEARDAVTLRLRLAGSVVMSAGTLVECFIVARRRGLSDEMRAAIDALAPEIVAVDATSAARIDRAYPAVGKGFHAAGLNFGDMFAYDAARALDAPLLYVGDDFAATDIRPAIS